MRKNDKKNKNKNNKAKAKTKANVTQEINKPKPDILDNDGNVVLVSVMGGNSIPIRLNVRDIEKFGQLDTGEYVAVVNLTNVPGFDDIDMPKEALESYTMNIDLESYCMLRCIEFEQQTGIDPGTM